MIQGSIKSKTMWASAITGMVGVAIETMPIMKEIISPSMYGYIFMGLSVVFAGLRFVTKKPLDEL